MNFDYVFLVVLRAVTGLALVAGAAWITWKIVAIFKARGRARRMKPDRRRRRVRVANDRRRGARREREASRAKLEDIVKSVDSPSGAQPPRTK